ncbi:TonB-dependent siderophore receptor [Pseudoduganella namucuonensis]|uniref:Outer membrane receptor proteins, mostly Fe transport n=1 Tax=Pseudoduganella namucuonensis TaxID=1035707 RepID=A0A1I7JXD6_9BURK|nr:TonB-dependent receptor [Pseudoduganella namucuonensis]SFU89735.1 Outer membrane receptor proteins, mostly Fe transport [Pseudoduganella namucuonensis]
MAMHTPRATPMALSIALAFIVGAEVHAAGQADAEAVTAPSAPSAADMLELNKVIVTGRGGSDTTKFQSSYSISTFSEKDLARKAPLSVAALLTQTPGVFAESSGGEVGNNVYSRGLPNDNYRYLPLLEDGLPVWEEGAGAFTNADLFFRLDATVRSAQIVRGGTASILANNAPGGSMNVITKKGTETFQGQVKLEAGDYDHLRTDFNLSGPLSEKVLFQLGGFLRTNNGLRDPGFQGNKGGQLRGGLTFKLDDGELFLGVRSLNDRNIFYTAMPMASPSRGLPGLSATEGTLVSSAFDGLAVPDGQGAFKQSFHLKDGIHTDTDTFTALYEKDLSPTLSIQNKFRRTAGSIDFNGLFSNGVDSAQSFLASGLGRLRAANPATVSAAYRVAGGDGRNLAPADLGNGLALTEGLWNTHVKLDNVINDFSVSKKLETGMGDHELTAGVYYSRFNQRQNWNWSDVLTEAVHQPRLLDVVGLNAAGGVTASLTRNGLLNLHTNLQEFHDHVRNLDYYLTDNWRLTKALRIDGGIRYHTVSKHGRIAQTVNKDLGDPATLADDSVAVFSGAFQPYTFKDEQAAWSVGANYEFSPSLSGFARAGRSFRITPEFAQWFNCCTPTENRIGMAEFGLKHASREYSAFVTAYHNNFPNLSFNTTSTVNGAQVTESASAAAKSVGLEAEFVWRPSTRFDVAFSGVLQKLKYSGFSGRGADGGAFNYTGNQIVRQPRAQASLRPAFHFGAGNAYDVFGEYRYTGKRYADVANTVALPAFGEIDLGFAAMINPRTRFQLLVTNLTDKVGVSEGNPRSGVILGGQQAVFQGRPNFGRHLRASIEYKF